MARALAASRRVSPYVRPARPQTGAILLGVRPAGGSRPRGALGPVLGPAEAATRACAALGSARRRLSMGRDPALVEELDTRATSSWSWTAWRAPRPDRASTVARGQGLERRAIEPRIERAAADALLLHRAVVELVEQRPNRGVQRGQAEGLVPEAEDPPLGHQHTHLRLCLVAGLEGRAGTRGSGEFLVGLTPGSAAGWMALFSVGHPQRRPPKNSTMRVSADPVRARRRLVGVAARPEDGASDRSLLACRSTIVADEGLRAGPMTWRIDGRSRRTQRR